MTGFDRSREFDTLQAEELLLEQRQREKQELVAPDDVDAAPRRGPEWLKALIRAIMRR